MIYGNINNACFEQQAAALPKALGSALKYLRSTDLTAHPAGRFPMELDGVNVVLQVMDLTTNPREALYPEIHHKYVDVQFSVSGGTEKHTWYTDDGRRTVHADALDTEKDILFYENDPAVPENTVYLNPGDYVVYFPWDVHAPGQHPDGQPSSFRKIVLKVPTVACV